MFRASFGLFLATSICSACSDGSTSDKDDTGETDTDTDTDSDTDTDTDADTDSDTDADTDTDTDTDADTDVLPQNVARLDGVDVELSVLDSCTDVTFLARNQGSGAALWTDVIGATEIANQAGGIYVGSIDLAVGESWLYVELEVGSQLDGNWCVGQYNPYDNPIVDTTYSVVAGQLDLTLDNTSSPYGTAELLFSDVDLLGDGGQVGRIDELLMQGVPFGMLPPP